MKLHDLAPPKGATKNKQRVGRGTGGKGHKTAGRGTKGQPATRCRSASRVASSPSCSAFPS
jgi:ribosomal protein L15